MIMDYVKEARNGSKEAYDYLYDYYFNIFIRKMIDIYGEEVIDEVKEVFPKVFNDYIDSNRKEKLPNYINRKINVKSTLDSNAIKKHYISEKLKNLDDENLKQLINHYNNLFYSKIKKYNNILTEEELKKFSRFITEKFLKQIVYNSKSDNILSIIISRLHSEIGYYKKDNENLLKRYIMYFGINDNIFNYVINKYEYILNENSCKYYFLIKDNYDKIIKNALLKLYDSYSISISIKSLINSEIDILKKEYEKEFIKKEKDKKSIIENKSFLKKSYSYIISLYYYKYKDIIKNEDLLEIITNKYNLYFDSYLKGNSSSNISKYITTRLSDYLNKLSLYDPNSVDEKMVEKSIINNTDILYNSMNNYKGLYPAFETLKKQYINYCYEYYKAKRKSSIKDYVYRKLNIYTRFLNKQYDEKYLDNIIDSFMNCKLIPDFLKNEYFSKVKKYYMDNKLYEKIPFDVYLADEIKNFDYESYIEINDIAKKMNKVLKHS